MRLTCFVGMIIVGALLTATSGLSAPPAGPTLKPDKEVQAAIDYFKKIWLQGQEQAIAQRQNPAPKTTSQAKDAPFLILAKALSPLKALSQRNPNLVIRQLVWRMLIKRDLAWYEFGFLLKELHLKRPAYIIDAMLPYIDSSNPHVRYWARDMLSGVENESSEKAISYYAQYLRSNPSPNALASYLFQRIPGKVLQIYAQTKPISRQDGQTYLWAERMVDTGLWKQQKGFLKEGQLDPAAVKELAKLSTAKAWFARQYVAEIMRQHPEYQNQTILKQLAKDPIPAVANPAKKALGRRYAPELMHAVWSGKIDAVKKVLAKEGADINAPLKRKTALINAVERNDLSMAKFLLENKADTETFNPQRMTPLCIAAKDGHFDMVRLLLSHNASLSPEDPKWSLQAPLVAVASLRRNASWQTQMLDLLLNANADINTRGHKRTASLAAAESGNLAALKYLIAKNADLKATFGEGASTHLMIAAWSGGPEILALLIKHGADINEQSKQDGRTALMYAVKAENIPTLKWLMEHHANINIKDHNGKTAMDHAAHSLKKKELLQLLNKHAKSALKK